MKSKRRFTLFAVTFSLLIIAVPAVLFWPQMQQGVGVVKPTPTKTILSKKATDPPATQKPPKKRRGSKSKMANLLLSLTPIDDTLANPNEMTDGDTGSGYAWQPAEYATYDLGSAKVIGECRVHITSLGDPNDLEVYGSNASDMSGAVLLTSLPLTSTGVASDTPVSTTPYRYLKFLNNGTVGISCIISEIEADEGAPPSPTRTPKPGLWSRIKQQQGR